MNNEIVYINKGARELFKKLGCGDIDYIMIYKKEGNDIYFSAGDKGKFKSDQEEINLFGV
jgi:hypothetical protein